MAVSGPRVGCGRPAGGRHSLRQLDFGAGKLRDSRMQCNYIER
jgi:hypothetical protein